MEARVVSLRELLGSEAAYQTPFFQRPYRWRERNWIAFWNGWARSAEAAALQPARDGSEIDDLGPLENFDPFDPDDEPAREALTAQEAPGAGAGADAAKSHKSDESDESDESAPSPPTGARRKLGAPPHFLGAIVLQGPAARRARPGPFDILDGQQRLLTACAAVRSLALCAEGIGAARTAETLNRMLRAPEQGAGGLRFRITASRASRDDQSAALSASPQALAASARVISAAPDGSALQAATLFFLRAAQATLASGDKGAALTRLISGLLDRTTLVRIDIDREMSAFEVFERLNNLGEPLSTLDLVKNRLFDAASRDVTADGVGRDEEALARLYARHWDVLDNPATLDFWGARVARGGDRRLNQDWFLRAYLSARVGREVRGTEIQDELADLLESSPHDGARHIADIGRAAEAFLEIGGHAEPERHAERIAALRLYGNVATEPALIAVHMHLWEDPEATEAVLDMLESCVVRRFFTKAEGSGYDEYARIAGLIGPGAAQRGPAVVAEVARRLKAAQRGRFWPGDKEFRKGFATRELVARGGATLKRNGKPIFFNVYAKLDAMARSLDPDGPGRSPEFDRRDQTVEHLYPLNGRKHWPQPKRTEAPWLRTIGNLAAIPSELNARLGQWAWAEKRAELQAHSDVYLNQRLCQDPRWATWSARKIRQRGDELAELALKVWRRPN